MDTVWRGGQGNLLPDDGAKVSDILWLPVRRTWQRKVEAEAENMRQGSL